MHIFINGKRHRAEPGETILAVARRGGIEIPTLCHHEALEPVGACRLCMVEIGHPKWGDHRNMVSACIYPVEPDLEVSTENEAVLRQRRTVLELLAARCPESGTIRDLCDRHGATPRYDEWTDGSKCIMCYLCVRACEAMGCSAISAVGRGTHKEVAPPFHANPEACVGCGSCAAICPTGHIEMHDTATTRGIWGRTFEFVPCADCGRPVITAAHRDHAAARRGLPADYYSKCEDCKRREIAARFAQVGS